MTRPGWPWAAIKHASSSSCWQRLRPMGPARSSLPAQHRVITAARQLPQPPALGSTASWCWPASRVPAPRATCCLTTCWARRSSGAAGKNALKPWRTPSTRPGKPAGGLIQFPTAVRAQPVRRPMPLPCKSWHSSSPAPILDTNPTGSSLPRLRAVHRLVSLRGAFVRFQGPRARDQHRRAGGGLAGARGSPGY